MQATDLPVPVVEDYYRLAPHLRDRQRVTFFLDKFQVVQGWEAFARRLMDSEQADLFLTGSSARLLAARWPPASRQRAGGVDPPVHFREALRHASVEPASLAHPGRRPCARRSTSACAAISRWVDSPRRGRRRGSAGTCCWFVRGCRHPPRCDRAPCCLQPPAAALVAAAPVGQPGNPVQRAEVLRRAALARHRRWQGYAPCFLGLPGRQLPRPHRLAAQRLGTATDGQSPQGVSRRSGLDTSVSTA